MSTQKHTPGPWEVGTGLFDDTARRYVPMVTAEARDVCTVTPTGRAGEPEANAARIVACVNACEGINPEAVPELVRALADLADCLDEAVRALPGLPSLKILADGARAALAKAKGGGNE